MTGEIPSLGIPEEVIESEDYQNWKQDVLRKLTPPHPVSSRQRFANQETHYDNPDREPGVVRFRVEDGEPFEPDLVGEAEAVQGSREYLLVSGKISDLNIKKNEIKDELTKKAEQGWRGTEFEDLGGTGRALSAIPQRSATVTDRDLLILTTGEDFSRVAETVLNLSVKMPEAHKIRGKVMQPEDLVGIINAVLAKARLAGEWTRQSIVRDIDVLRELIERDLVSPESVEIDRSFILRPDVLPTERTPKPQEPQEK